MIHYSIHYRHVMTCLVADNKKRTGAITIILQPNIMDNAYDGNNTMDDANMTKTKTTKRKEIILSYTN